MIHFVVQRWDEDQADTICEGVFHSEDRAVAYAEALARTIAKRSGRSVFVDEDDVGGGTRWIVCHVGFHDTEPTDDERHHAIWTQKVQSPA